MNYLPRLALNGDPPNLSLSSSTCFFETSSQAGLALSMHPSLRRLSLLGLLMYATIPGCFLLIVNFPWDISGKKKKKKKSIAFL
jgi:hypothetical protein